MDAFCLIEEEGFIEIGAQIEEASQFGIDGHRDVQLGFGANAWRHNQFWPKHKNLSVGTDVRLGLSYRTDTDNRRRESRR